MSRDDNHDGLVGGLLAVEIRRAGWAVAVHNDYRLGGKPHTFWLFTKGDHCAKGEGPTDAIALEQVKAAIARIEAAPPVEIPRLVDRAPGNDPRPRVVLSGSFRRDIPGLRAAWTRLRDCGYRVISPPTVEIESEQDGFVRMRGESAETEAEIEALHLEAIQSAEFVWLHVAEDGYVGLSAAMEVGYAHACGIPVYASTAPAERAIAQFVTLLDGQEHRWPVPFTLLSLQHYYRRVAKERGYATEDAAQCLLLMVEEVAELSKALQARQPVPTDPNVLDALSLIEAIGDHVRTLRRRTGLTRHERPVALQQPEDAGLELADVFLYVVHLANTLRLDLAGLVTAKEAINHARFVAATRGTP